MPLFRHPSKEPLWRDEFSVFAADERYVTRRQFAKFLTLASLGMFAGNLWILIRSWLWKPPQFSPKPIAQIGEIPVGGTMQFSYPRPDDYCLLIRLGDDNYVAYSQKCTHLSCAVYFSASRSRLECPCHEGCFSVRDGSVLQGPPTRPLPRVLLERQGETLVAVRMENATEG
jgi:Rieske Fe-S protein